MQPVLCKLMNKCKRYYKMKNIFVHRFPHYKHFYNFFLHFYILNLYLYEYFRNFKKILVYRI